MSIRKAALLPLLLSCAVPPALADDPSWLVRVRAVDVLPDAKSDPLSGIDVENKVIPEVDISYFFTPNWAVELILTYPQRHNLTLNGAPIGSLKHLPPTLTAQYHFLPGQTFQPYAGIGVNYTRFSDVNLLSGALDVDRSSVGAAFQLGLDIAVSPRMVVNIDIKKVLMSTDVKVASTGAKVATLDIDPLLIGIGIGWKF